MEKIIKTGKKEEEIVSEILAENSLKESDILFKTSSYKKGLFKSEMVEVTVYKKDDLISEVKDFLKDLITNLGLEVNFEVKKQDDNTVIKIYSNNNNILIGHNGSTLKALEVLSRQHIQAQTGLYFKINLDVENYKDKVAARLERLAKQTAKDVVRTKTVAKMENMNAYERRIVHNALTNFKGVKTVSEGQEPNRHIVISPTD